MANKMEVSLVFLLLAGSFGSLDGASFDRGSYRQTSTPTTTTSPAPVTTTGSSVTSSRGPSRFETGVPTKLSSPPPVAPVWNHATGEFVMDNSIQSSYKKYEKPPKPQQGNHTGRYSRPPAKSQPQYCPPCPCLNQPSPKPANNEDLHRSRRGTEDDYWHSTGPANPVLSQINMGYSAQKQMHDFFMKYGFPLHIGGINQADFNYPNDFSAFEQPATSFTDVRGTVVYRLVGPIEVIPFGSLVGPIPNAPDAFRTLVVNSGVFKLLGIQKDGIMKIMDESRKTWLVYCSSQRIGNCQNLVPTRDVWDIRKFDTISG